MDYASHSFDSLGLNGRKDHIKGQHYLDCYSCVFNVLIRRERNQRAFKDSERHMVDLKLTFLRTIMEWMAAVSSHSFPSILAFIDDCM